MFRFMKSQFFNFVVLFIFSSLAFADDGYRKFDSTTGGEKLYSRNNTSARCYRTDGIYTQLETMHWNLGADEKLLPSLIYKKDSIILHFIFSNPTPQTADSIKVLPETIEIVGYILKDQPIEQLTVSELYAQMSIAFIPESIKGELNCITNEENSQGIATPFNDSPTSSNVLISKDQLFVSINCFGTGTPFSSYESFEAKPIKSFKSSSEVRIIKHKRWYSSKEAPRTYKSLYDFLKTENVCDQNWTLAD